jgi:hypothetical protein
MSRRTLLGSRGEEAPGSIRVEARDRCLRLLYVWTPSDAESVSMDYFVRIESTECHFGGSRPWLRCPRCWRRSAILYGVASDGRFGCRHCMRVAYSSETESRVDGINRKLHKLQGRLEEGEQSWLKPKWMRWRTFERICGQLDAADEAWGSLVFVRLAPLLLRGD